MQPPVLLDINRRVPTFECAAGALLLTLDLNKLVKLHSFQGFSGHLISRWLVVIPYALNKTQEAFLAKDNEDQMDPKPPTV